VKKLIIVISFIILTALFFGLYDLKYDYFEESKADRIADYIVLTIYILILLFFIVTGLYISIKKNNFKPIEFLKEIGLTTFLMLICHFAFIRGVLSGTILFLNSNIGIQNEIIIDGRVTKKKQISGKGATNELTILTNSNNIFLFDLVHSEISKYEIDTVFKKTMKVGCFGLVYR
jgi:hypothetical protein